MIAAAAHLLKQAKGAPGMMMRAQNKHNAL
jgi:hypothetical protein